MTLASFAVQYMVGRSKGGGSHFDSRVHGSIAQDSSRDEESVPVSLQFDKPIVMSAPLGSSRRFLPRIFMSLGTGRIAANNKE